MFNNPYKMLRHIFQPRPLKLGNSWMDVFDFFYFYLYILKVMVVKKNRPRNTTLAPRSNSLPPLWDFQ